jgi:DNA-binding transcriptional MerR regulator
MSDGYSMQELAERSGFEPRTIRLYIQRGLLRGADRRGPGATYEEGDLHRLRFIRALRDKVELPLDEIRRLLLSLPEEQIRNIGEGRESIALLPLLGEPDVRTLASALGSLESVRESNAGEEPGEEAGESGPGSALEYLRSLRRGGRSPRSRRSGRAFGAIAGNEPSAETEGRLERVADTLEGLLRKRRRRRARGETWVSIPILPDVELRARDQDEHSLSQLERIADVLRQMLLGDLDDTDRPKPE